MYTKTRSIVIALAALSLSGCLQSTLNLPPDEEKLARLEAGTLESSLRLIAGEPDRILRSKSGYRTYYYRANLSSNCFKALQACIPVVIENGKVAAVGSQWTRAWEQQRRKNAVSRLQICAGSEKAHPAVPSQKMAQLEKQAQAIPMSRTVDNLNIYRYLLKLEPDNPRYLQKVFFYQKRFEEEKAQRVASNKRLAATRKWQNEILREFEGHRPVQMAARILGNGKFYIWLKNTGKTSFQVLADQFFLTCNKGERFKIYSSKDFGRKLAPGETIEGRVTFNTGCTPRQIIYANPAVATVTRNIPLPELRTEHWSASVYSNPD